MTRILDAQHVTVRYDRFMAVRNVSLHLDAGQLMGLVGPNGAGKTSLFRALAGLHPLAGGQVRVLERDVTPFRRDAMGIIGFAPDTPPVYETLTVTQYLEYIGRVYGLRRELIAERIDFWLEQLWLNEKRDARIGALSRGMRQRLIVARTLIPDPVLVILDEPAAGLDPAGRIQFRQLLTSLRDQGKALIVSSHILADLHEYCTHIGIIEHGQMRQFTTVAEFVTGQANNRCRFRVVLAAPQAGVEHLFGERDGLSGLRVDGCVVTFEYHDDGERAAALLADLVRKGVRVAAFAPIQLNLEEAYLRAGIRQVD